MQQRREKLKICTYTVLAGRLGKRLLEEWRILEQSFSTERQSLQFWGRKVADGNSYSFPMQEFLIGREFRSAALVLHSASLFVNKSTNFCI